MIIKLSPQRNDSQLSVVKNGDALELNGEVYDFSPLQEGDVLPNEAIDSVWFCGDVTREGGEIILTLFAPHGANPTEAQAYPDPLFNVKDGYVVLPGEQE